MNVEVAGEKRVSHYLNDMAQLLPRGRKTKSFNHSLGHHSTFCVTVIGASRLRAARFLKCRKPNAISYIVSWPRRLNAGKGGARANSRRPSAKCFSSGASPCSCRIESFQITILLSSSQRHGAKRQESRGSSGSDAPDGRHHIPQRIFLSVPQASRQVLTWT